MKKYNGKHWFDAEKKMRFMEVCGHVFFWDVACELWRLYEVEA